MIPAVRRLSPLALLLLLAFSPAIATAQSQGSDDSPRRDERETEQTSTPATTSATFSFVLRYAGEMPLDPFGSSGRREVLQLMVGESPHRGQFRRARLDRLGHDDWAIEGWYEIRGDVIRLYHRDRNGSATGRVEVGRYLEETICFQDRVNGLVLSFQYVDPTSPSGSILDPADPDPATESIQPPPCSRAPAREPAP